MIATFNNQSFLSRIALVISERDKHPWGASIGLSTGMVARMTRGKIPGPETLQIIQLVENVSLDWLLSGRGPPYLVHRPSNDAKAALMVQALLGDEPADWLAYLVTDGFRAAVVLSCGDRYTTDDVVRDYRRIEVLEGAGSQTLSVLDESDVQARFLAVVSAKVMSRIIEGEAGTFGLFGDDEHPGLLAEAVAVHRLSCGINEETAVYEIGNLTEPESDLISRFRKLPKPDQDRLQTIAQALTDAVG